MSEIRGFSKASLTGPDTLSASRNNSIDVLRCVSILAVMVLHFVACKLFVESHMFLAGTIKKLSHPGTLGVTLFFTISGFLITRMTLERPGGLFGMSAPAFYARRAARILPLLLLVVMIGIAAMKAPPLQPDGYQAVVAGSDARFEPWFWASIATFTFNWARIFQEATSGVFGWGLHWDVLWSLAVEEQFYLLFPLVILLTGSTERLVRVLAVVIVAGFTVRTAGNFLGWTWLQSDTNSFACFDAIALGVLCAALGRSRPLPQTRARLWVLGGAVLIVAAWLTAVAGTKTGLVELPLSVGACLFLHGALTAGLFRSWIWWLPARIGQLSYGLYLLHGIVLYAGSTIFLQLRLVPGLALFLLLCIGAAQLVYTFYEDPMNRNLRALLLGGSRRRAIAAKTRLS